MVRLEICAKLKGVHIYELHRSRMNIEITVAFFGIIAYNTSIL